MKADLRRMVANNLLYWIFAACGFSVFAAHILDLKGISAFFCGICCGIVMGFAWAITHKDVL